MTLAEIKVGQDAVLRTIGGQGELRHHLLDMGLTPGTEVTLRKVAPMGDPIEVELRGYELRSKWTMSTKRTALPAARHGTRLCPTPVWANCARPPATTTARRAVRSPKDSRCVLPWPATRTAAKRRCSIS